ncbi:MAG: hypothetical protein LBL41_04310 [Bifidobacteriaceae bacterium]|jgi:ribose 5-phosphate isomerase RpiB|nr:hypothetical protein [Bifidobacteriaceae bacterium]
MANDVVNVDNYERKLNVLATRSYNAYKQAYSQVVKTHAPSVERDEELRNLFKQTSIDFGNAAASLAVMTWNTVYGTDHQAKVHTDAFRIMLDYDEIMSNSATNRQLTDLRTAMMRYVRASAGNATMIYSEHGNGTFARKTRGKTCAFCIMLAGRGYVYRSSRAAGRMNAYHKRCDCVIVSRKDGYKINGYDPDIAKELARNVIDVGAMRTLPDGTERKVPWFQYKKKQGQTQAEADAIAKVEQAEVYAKLPTYKSAVDNFMKKGTDVRKIRNTNVDYEPKATGVLKGVAKDTNMLPDGLDFRVKGVASHMRKVIGRDKDNKAYTGTDELRYTLLPSNDNNFATEAQNAIDSFKSAGYKIIDFQNRYAEQTTGYRDVSLVLKDPKTGAEFELQLNTKSMADAKTEMHPTYEEQRVLERGTPEWMRLENKMNIVYNEVVNEKGAENIHA